MDQELLLVALRQQALYLPDAHPDRQIRPATAAFARQLSELGFALDEPLLHAVNGTDSRQRIEVLNALNTLLGTRHNWTAKVRQWNIPTGETRMDHLITWLANLFQTDGTRLACGHIIPEDTFPLERYTACPFCGTPFETSHFTFSGQGSKLQLLRLWGDAELTAHLEALLCSPVPLDATQQDSLRVLLRHLPIPAVEVGMKETLVAVVSELVEQGRGDEAGQLFRSPVDVMRYLWFQKTGDAQIVDVRTLRRNQQRAYAGWYGGMEQAAQKLSEYDAQLRLKYSRRECKMVARWLNDLPMAVEQMCEAMHPRRRMWVRFIRALRLTEYAKRQEMTHLRELLDRFYRQDYAVWAGRVEAGRLQNDESLALQLLSQRPGLFARSLFAAMLRFGPEGPLRAFSAVAGQLPRRLLVTLGQYAGLYFQPDGPRSIRPRGGAQVLVKPNRLLHRYTAAERAAMVADVKRIYLDEMRRYFASLLPSPSTIHDTSSTLHDSPSTIYIDPRLFDIPLPIGDRATTVQDTSAALQGTRFPVEGDSVRLFLHWGVGLPAQHLDMDLSAYLIGGDQQATCSYFSLTTPGAQHSGDIQQIPDQVGTAEYIELNLPELEASGTELVVFTCNAYTGGNLEPNLRVGWMNSRYPMKIDEKTGVAYDPSTVQHAVRITEANLAKGLIFGVLSVAEREITWLEMPFDGQTVLSVSPENIRAYLNRLRQKLKIGDLLQLKAEAQHLQRVDEASQADEVYDYQWALDTARVSALLLG
ncbi:MAG: hypothetical protein IJ710_08405 [Prevotella sp.]|nr:hypothetical protein [Prevotella sp.]